jgi:hypothetical protein
MKRRLREDPASLTANRPSGFRDYVIAQDAD